MKIKKTFSHMVLFSYIFISAVFSNGQSLREKDGTDWLNTSGGEQFNSGYNLGFVAGLISGTTIAREVTLVLGSAFTNLYGESFWKNVYQFKKLEDMKETLKAIEAHLNNLSLLEITVGQIKDGLETFYKEFSNRKIKIVDAIYIVKIQIKGENPELIDSQIRFLRMQPINQVSLDESLKRISDFNSKKGHFPTYKEIKDGEFSKDDIIKIGSFIDESNINHNLFCYGIYK